MHISLLKHTSGIAAGLLLALATTAAHAESSSDKSAEHDHAHQHDDHAHDDHDHDNDIYQGYFEDDQVADRPLTDWAGDWQSVYPYLQDGTLDEVMTHKAEDGDMTAEEYKAYYEVGYKSDIDRIVIDGDQVTFYEGDDSYGGTYTSGSYEILTYEKGNRGVRFIFEKAGGDDEAPGFIQFSDHKIAPETADHYHIYLGDDKAALLEEVTNWPTFYPSNLSAEDIVHEMIAH